MSVVAPAVVAIFDAAAEAGSGDFRVQLLHVTVNHTHKMGKTDAPEAYDIAAEASMDQYFEAAAKADQPAEQPKQVPPVKDHQRRNNSNKKTNATALDNTKYISGSQLRENARKLLRRRNPEYIRSKPRSIVIPATKSQTSTKHDAMTAHPQCSGDSRLKDRLRAVKVLLRTTQEKLWRSEKALAKSRRINRQLMQSLATALENDSSGESSSETMEE